MKKFILVLFILCLTINFSTVLAQEITVSGYGNTFEDAERDALRTAVEKAVGTMVDSQTLVQNNQLVNDEIYTHSKGYITNYSVLEKIINVVRQKLL